MTDREMLELAAKAAGLRLDELGGRIVRREIDGQPVYWNPLTGDGDALRLAVKLGIDIVISVKCPSRSGACPPHLDLPKDYLIEDHGTDAHAATRRAIVRAAAEIGRNMA
jgi:hypothetical protein